jgi:hypothetical protein
LSKSRVSAAGFALVALTLPSCAGGDTALEQAPQAAVAQGAVARPDEQGEPSVFRQNATGWVKADPP